MKCVDFRKWLLNRDPAVERPGGEPQSHLEACPICRSIYALDSRLDALLVEGLASEVELPAGLVAKVDMNLKCLEEGGRASGLKGVYAKAAAVIVALAAMVVVFLNPLSGRIESIDELGRLAVHNHLSHLAIVFTADDVDDVPAWFRDRLAFRVVMPDIRGRDLTLIGGRKCSLGGADVAYLFYHDGRNDSRVSVFIMDSKSLGFDAEEMKKYRLTIGKREVTFWKAGRLAYVVVE